MTTLSDTFCPDFFIIGAPKAGTTLLFDVLAQQGSICAADQKEPHFFATDLDLPLQVKSQSDYERLFATRIAGQLCFEASVMYMHSKTAIPNILRQAPDAQFILMLRDPVTLLPSQFHQMRFGLHEPEKTFEQAWARAAMRSNNQDQRILQSPYRAIMNYQATALFGQALQRLYALVPKKNVLVLIFEEFVQDQDTACEQISRFLGCEIAAPKDSKVVNPATQHRLPALAKLLSNPPFPLNHVKRLLKSGLGLNNTQAMKLISRANTSNVVKTELSEPLSADIRRTYREDRQLLETLLHRQITCWPTE